MMFETATMLPVAATLVALATLVGMVLLLLGCLQCLFPKKKRGFSTLEEGSELDSTRARSNPSFAPDLDTSDTVINIEPLPETIGDLRASSLSLPPLRPRITCLEKGKLDNALKLITFHHPFSRSQILYLNGIGHGWFGEVIESDAEKIISGVSKSRVVVKQLKDDASQMEQSMFLADVAAFREAEHTNVLRLLGQCTETHPFLMILEYMAMGNLKSYLRAHKNEDSLINKHKLLKFAIDAASGLACLHRHGYAHSDFSARNCLVSADFTVKVGDYGISEENFREDYFNTGRELLPIRWMARESLALSNGTWCAQAPSKEADMWAFGVMLWEVISLGHQPYQDLSDDEVLKKVVIAEKPLKLPKPATALPLSDRLYEVMQFCWMDSKNRLKVEQAHLLLQHILSTCMEPPTSQAVPGDSFEERWNTLIPNDAKASLPKKPARVAPPPPAAREVEENISRTEAKMVTAEAAAPKVHPGSGDAPPAAAFRVQPVAPPRVSRKVDVHGGGDATAAEKPPQPPKSVDSAAIAAPVATPRAAPRREASAVEKSTPAPLASAHPGDVRPDKSDTSEVVSSSAAPATPKVDAIQTEPPKKEVPPELPVSAPAEADWGGVKVPPPKEKPEDAKSYGEGADVQAAFESLSAFDNSDSAADMDHHSSSANTTADSFLMVDVEDAAHTGLDSPMADPHRTSTPAQASPQPGTGDSQRMHLSPDAGETTVNTTAASFFTARDASTSPGSSGFQTAEATLNKDESSTAEMFGEFTDSSLSTQPSVQDNTLPMAGQDEMVSGQHGQLLTGAGISSVEQALFEASQEEENDAPCKEGATAMQKSDFGEKTLVQEKYPSTEEGEGENWSHLAVETLSSDTSFEWEKVSATEMKDEAATSEASIGKAEDHDLSFDVASLSSTSAASGILADKASLELGSLENIGSTSNLEPAPQATESNDTSLLDAADVMSLSSSETCPPSQPEGSLEEPAAEQVSLDSSSSTEVTASPAGELSPSSGLSTPSQVGSPIRGLGPEKSESSTCTDDSDSESDTSSSSSYVCEEPHSTSSPDPSSSRPQNLYFGDQDLALASEIYLSRGLKSPRTFERERGPLETIPEDPVDTPAAPYAPSDASSADVRYEDVFDFEWDDFMGEPLVGRDKVTGPSPCQSLDMSDWQFDGDSDSLRSFASERHSSQNTRPSGGSETSSVRSSLGETEVKSSRGRSSRTYVAGLMTNRVGGPVAATYAASSSANPWGHATSFYSLYEDFDSDDSGGASETEANHHSESESLELGPAPSGKELVVDVHANDPELIARPESAVASVTTNPAQVAVGTTNRKLPEVAEPAAQDQLSHLPATPAAVQIVVQDFSDDAPSPGLPVSISSSPSSDSSKPPLSNVALSGDLPLSASSFTGSSDPFSFPSTAFPGQDVTADPFQGLGMSEPSPGSWSEEGSVQSDKKLHSKEPQLVSTDLSTDLLGSTHGVHEDTKVDKDTIASGQSQASQSSITDDNLLGFDQFSPHNSDSSSMEPTSLVLDKAQKEKDAIFDLKPSSSSGKDSLLDFSAFEEGPGGGHSSSASTGNTAAEVTSQSLGLMPSKVDSSEKQESFSGLEGDELFGWDQLQGTGIVPAAGESTGKAPAFLPTSPAQSGSQQTASEEESMPSTLPDQNFPSLDSQASSDLLAEDSSLLDFGMATPSEAKSLHESASNVALVDLDEFAGGESTPTEGEAEATRSAVDDLLGM